MVAREERLSGPQPMERSEESKDLEEKIRNALGKIEECFARLLDLDVDDLVLIFVGNVFGGPLGGLWLRELAERCRNSLHTAYQAYKETCDKHINPFLTNIGDPWQLDAAASAWSAKIGGPVSKQASLFTPNSMEIIDYWTGDAKEAYDAFLPTQYAAIEYVSSLANELNPLLTQCASAINRFWFDIERAAATALAELIMVLNRSFTPDILMVPGEAIQTFVNSVLNAREAVKTAAEEYTQTAANLEKLLHSNVALPRGHWPRPKSAIYDMERWGTGEGR